MHIPHSRPNFGQAFEKAAQSVVHSGFLAQGKEVAALEKAIQNNLNNQHVIAVDSGTSALTLAIRALTQHKPNARVGIPAYACASLLFAVKASGALPIFMDCNTSLCLDREPALHIAKTLDILILVHPFGMVEPLVTETFSCPVIEDIAQSAGATLHGKPVGTFTGMSIGSLYATKPWGGAYGGFISSTHTNLIEDIRAMSDPDDANLKAAYVGHHQLSNLHASIALVKQKIYTQEAAQRQHWSNLYDIALQDLNVAPIHAKQSNHFRYIIRCPHGASQIITQFQALGIAAMHPVQTPLHHAKATHACSHADSAWKHCVSIPLLADMSEGEFAYLQQGLKTCLNFLDHQYTRWAALFVGLLLVIPWQVQGLLTHGVFLFFASLCLAFAIMPLVIHLAKRFDAMDYPDARRVHATPTPRIGGLAVIIAVNITLLLNFNYSIEFKGVVVSALIVGLLSLWDDVKELSAKTKLLGQIIAVAVLMYCDVVIHFAPDTWWGHGLEYIVTAFWVIGITNAFNFLDGINGLATSLATITCLLMGMLAWHTEQVYMLFICLAVAGGSAGFLPDNARYQSQARSFLGDVGSTYLGWIMAAIAVMGDWSGDSSLKAYAAPLLIFSVMIFDMIYTTISRIARGDVHNFREWIEYVGKDHLHHRLMDIGCTQAQAVILILSFSILMGLAALALVKSAMISVVLLLAQAVIFYLVLSMFMLRVHKND